ncbi:uncharacterized protein LOC143302798 [Bombus vancouverensis nearcticus]|uniref:uncharacterized protein LOC143302798 n=1 Tax=Bombus vancouverensis nearcticus TaxID=2705178 RepID=UPI00223965B2
MDQRAKSSQFNWSKQQRMLRVTEFVWREHRFVYLKFKVITGYSDVACASARIPKCVLVYVTVRKEKRGGTITRIEREIRRLTGYRVDIDRVYHQLIHDDDAVGSLDGCAARCNSGNGELLAKQPASLDNQTNDPQLLYLNFPINFALHI